MFDQVFPYFLSIGMPPEYFWDGDPWLVEAYFKAHKLQIEQKNEEMWLQGLYIFDALNVTATNVLQSLSKKRRKAVTYMEKPIRLTPLSEEEQRQKEEIEKQKLIDYLNRFEKQWKKTKVPSA